MQNHYNFERIASILCNFICTYNREIQDISKISNAENDYNDNDSKLSSFINDLQKIIPENGEDFEKVLEEFKSKLIINNGLLMNLNHPLNFSSFPATSSITAILGEILTSTIGGLLFSSKTNSTLAEFESSMLDWYGNLLGIPLCFKFSENTNTEGKTEGKEVGGGGERGGGGCFQDGISDVFQNIILAAIKRYMKYFTKSTHNDQIGNISKWLEKAVVYASEDSCPIISQICTAQMITLRLVETNKDGIMTVAALKYKIDLDTDIGMKPILVIATFGTYRKFAVDEIKNIGNLLKMYQTCWFHVDGTYGGNALILKRYHHLKDGLETADSIAVSLNQWTPIGLNCVALWIQNLREYQNYFRTPLAVHFDHNSFNQFDYRYYGLSTTYKSKALAIWITLRLYGKKFIENRLRKAIYLTERMCELLQSNREIEIVQVKFTFLNFILQNRNDTTNEEFFKNLLRTEKIIVTPIKLNGRFTIRFSVISEHVKEKHIVEAANIISSIASEFSEVD